MNPYSSMAIQACLIAALLGLGRTGSAAEPAGHAHGEAGHLPPQAAAPADAYVDSEPPLWENLGALSYPITTRQARAQRYFDQGLKLAYAFNHLEARRAFRMAEKLDPECALCLWGEALVLGPNINAPMDGSAVGPAWSAIRQAKALGKHASAKERALIEALSKRYAKAPKTDRKALDRAYAAAMGKLHGRYPEDADIAVLYAESLMDLSPWDYWRDGGRTPKGRTADTLKVLERVLAQHPDHPGAIHYYIHMVEASDRPERAEPYAERLAALAPGAGHLVHMPGHLYYRLGRYRDALEANRAAIAVDEAYLKETGAAGFYAQAYYPHNVHFLLASAQMAGDGDTALAAADKLAGLIPDAAARTVPLAQPIKVAPYFAKAQFSAPEAVLKLPEPGPELPYVQAMWRYARGVALATTGAGREARAELDALAEIARTADFTGLSAAGIPAPDIVRIAQAVLTARIAQAEGEYGKAAASLEKAAVLQDRLPYMEPPYWYYPVHRSLGAARFLSGDLAAAERELQASLRAAPNDAWALWGLSEVYRKQGKADAAAEVERRLAKTRADKGVTIAMEKL
ncbi:tetratricopeptide repeat protein [Candidatus Methylocalor cossyra]|uniref:Tetratricopeptide repeat protein n=1 Tax=Candidatus Methylocalor cossyra TaxID=3108543 RepID=A0ABP1C446_9GAMM